jgi:hypothetical protein|tara:strand:+ start:1971 stop:2708 length:738 start_codon:yes stop_codon:yes gene_type:complete
MNILTPKEYAYYITDQCYEKEAYKFKEHNITVEELKSLLDSNFISDGSCYKGKKCIVIGNGGSVLEAERGKEIDKFDIIVRSNLARYEGYEQFVGSRTDVRFLSHKTFGNTLDKNFSSYSEDFLPNSPNHHLIIRSAGNIGSMIPGFAKNKNHTFSILDLKYNTYIDKLTSDHHYCSVGFSAIHTMMELGADVYIYGIDFYNPLKKYHYFEECTPLVQTGRQNHSGSKEKSYIQKLIKENIIKTF